MEISQLHNVTPLNRYNRLMMYGKEDEIVTMPSKGGRERGEIIGRL